MTLKPIIKSNICLNAHPVGLRGLVREEIAYVKSRPRLKCIGNALVIGASTGYGLASRVAAAFGAGAATVGVASGRFPTAHRTGNVGYYTTRAFEEEAAAAGLKAKSFFGDAFSHEIKTACLDYLEHEGMKIDLLVYSLAAGARKDPDGDRIWRGVIKPIGRNYSGLTVDVANAGLKPLVLYAATAEEIESTIKVMGGEDWELWVRALLDRGLAAPGMGTVAYSYIGPALTAAVYREGTLGRAKKHLEATAVGLDGLLSVIGGRAVVSVNKAAVTRSSAVIPLVPLYISFLYRVMRKRGLHEGCIEQAYRLFAEKFADRNAPLVDQEGRIRLDDWELREDVQAEVGEGLELCLAGDDPDCADVREFREEFLRFHGFAWPGVDYGADVDIS
ncbi:MAG: enoyl-[acyl-carrier-protein] reductase FabV [Spirochaetales bacterium]|nr:enoyl-[acyl-carrier-protein] reductase FabV [Spirochaetales bacterium]